MAIHFSPKTRRNIGKLIPYGVIWLVTGWIFLFAEEAATAGLGKLPEGVIELSLPVFIFASLASFAVGLLVGVIELVWLEDAFKDRSFSQKLFFKVGIYLLIMLSIIMITYPIANAIEENRSVLDVEVWQKLGRYLISINFISTLVQMAFSLFIVFFYAGIRANVGQGVLLNFFTGKYHKPVEENRIFMFLDMKSSTTIAERLGHTRYFELLRKYYSSLSDAIIAHHGDVYQYIGDEIVITWEYEAGLSHANCIDCFFSMKETLQKKGADFEKAFGFLPTFKAGLHLGEVTTGEIGALKKEIFYTGDVLNVTSRIQSLCNQFQKDFLVSEELINMLPKELDYPTESLGKYMLKGRKEAIGIVAVG
ncbi:MAG: adenylate/guanylate cyclase domain-containing protein [Bacteroidota bacterium]